jgi:hypothetical protein
MMSLGDGVVGFWDPPADLVATLESRLKPALEVGRTKPETVIDLPLQWPQQKREMLADGVSMTIDEILKGFAEYRCQYLGIVERGHGRRVFVNCFDDKELADFRTTWFNPYSFDDGGACCWRITYDVATCGFLDFDVNASA